MHEYERLELLKEIAGTRVYDDRRKESQRIMVETARRYTEIGDILEGIDKRLEELEEEKEELAEYQSLDRDRRCLEFTLYDQELQRTSAILEDIELKRAALNEKTQETHGETLDLSSNIVTLSNSIASFQVSLASLIADSSRTTSDLTKLNSKATNLEFNLADAVEAEKSQNDQIKQYRTELNSIVKKIADTVKRLDFLKQPYEDIKAKEEKLKVDLDHNQARLSALYAKQSRASKYRNKNERDEAINKELASLDKMLKQPTTEINTVTKDIQNFENEYKNLTVEQKNVETRLNAILAQSEEQNPKLNDIKSKRDELINSRKELWRVDAEIEETIRVKSEELRKAEQTLNSTLNKGTSVGLKILKTILAEHKIKGVRGPLIDLIKCEDAFSKCAETVAANRLFQIVVDNDDVVSEILKKMKIHKQGRLTFMPLKRLSKETFDYPESSDHVVPLISQLKFEPIYKEAVNQVFGRTLVARSLQLASEYSRKLDFDCVTLDGDQVNRKGAFSGGYVDFRSSRMTSYRQTVQLAKEIEDLIAKSNETKLLIDKKEQEITQIYSSLQKEETLRGSTKNEISQLKLSLDIVKNKISSIDEILPGKKSSLQKISKFVEELNDKIKVLKDELKTAFTSSLSAAESSEIDSLNESISQLQNSLATIITEKTNVEVEVKNSANLLKNNLEKKKSELENSIAADLLVADTEDLKRELKLVNQEIKEVQEKINSIEHKKEELNDKINKSQAELEKLKNVEQDRRNNLSAALNQIEKLHSKKSVIEAEKDECVHKIRELGAMPSQAHSNEYRKLTNAAVKSRLEKCLQSLNKFSAVNRKAIDQYLQFNEKRVELVARREELDKGKVAIDDLIVHLDHQKDEAIQRTFKSIAVNFGEVFTKLVPEGHGSLVMLKASSSNKQGEEVVDKNNSSVINYSGVGIRVSFTGIETVTSMTQLSGGQQTVVALALLFAIQLCDPSPFYFFDEIDAALDPSYRTAIANMLMDQKTATQFIVTTFRPEILNAANLFYKVEYTNRISVPSVINHDEASRVIAEIEHEMQNNV